MLRGNLLRCGPCLARYAMKRSGVRPESRSFHGSAIRRHGYPPGSVDDSNTVNVVFVDRTGEKRKIAAPIGANILEVAHANDIELEGACEGSLACSTCHVYLDQKSFDMLADPTDDEADMLDLAFGLAEK
jgi:ferredoxin